MGYRFKLSNFHANILSLSENIAKSFMGYFFDSHCISQNREETFAPLTTEQQGS